MQEILNATGNVSESQQPKLCWQKLMNKSSVGLDDHDKALLCKGLRSVPTPSWCRSVA